jgi:outer membrane immunogenic protein
MGDNHFTVRAPRAVAATVETNMRRLVCGLLLAGVAAPAFAGDFLRGSTTDVPLPRPYARWSGFYGGGQVGADFHNTGFTNDGNSTIAQFKSTDPVLSAVAVNPMLPLGNLTTTGPSYGGFVGYNYQIDDIVLGIELDLSHAASTTTANQNQAATPGQLATGTITQPGQTTTANCSACYTIPGTPPTVLNGFSTITSSVLYIPSSVTTQNTASATLRDYGTARIRGGWAYDNFLPYVAVGLSVARIDSTETVVANYVGTSVTTTTTSTVPNPQTNPASAPKITVSAPVAAPVSWTHFATETANGKYTFGFAAALGLDYALTRNFFVRGEVEYLQFSTPSNVTLNTASARVGGGLKF